MIHVRAERWYGVRCANQRCRRLFLIPVHPGLVTAYSCPACLIRYDRPPLVEYDLGPAPAGFEPIALGEGIYVCLPESMDHDRR